MSFSYKRYIATTSNHNPKRSAHIVEWENSYNFYRESLDNCLHWLDFINSILPLDELGEFKSSEFWCKMEEGRPRNFVTNIVHYVGIGG